ncbi:MAG: hydrogenase maturation nickel metallochaperone HypA [Gammaproteobacteria bacterium]|nr:hydrogenase maturation nickel metallochaperone HypA [Gammaproteobacteria bacterium]
MHEMSTCRSLIKQIEKSVQDYVDFKILSVDVSIGQLTNIDINELEDLFPLAAQNTVAQNATLNILSVAPDINCLDCDNNSLSENRELVCPICHSTNTIPLNGTDMLLTNVELESEE